MPILADLTDTLNFTEKLIGFSSFECVKYGHVVTIKSNGLKVQFSNINTTLITNIPKAYNNADSHVGTMWYYTTNVIVPVGLVFASSYSSELMYIMFNTTYSGYSYEVELTYISAE